MISHRHEVSQAVRVLYLLAYLLFLFLMNWLAFNQWLPLTTPKGLWFYSGTAALILGSLLVTPYYTSPANAISYLVAALIAVTVYEAPTQDSIDTLPRNLVILFCLLMLVACFVNIFLKNSRQRSLHNVSEVGRMLADHLGSPRFVYGIVVIYALWEYHRDSPIELVCVGVSGIVIASHQPLETFGNMVRRIAEVWRPDQAASVVGGVVAHQVPGILLIRLEDTQAVDVSSCLLVADEHGPLTRSQRQSQRLTGCSTA